MYRNYKFSIAISHLPVMPKLNVEILFQIIYVKAFPVSRLVVITTLHIFLKNIYGKPVFKGHSENKTTLLLRPLTHRAVFWYYFIFELDIETTPLLRPTFFRRTCKGGLIIEGIL